MAERQLTYVKRNNGSKLSEIANKFDVSIKRVRKIIMIESTGRARNDYRAGWPHMTTS